MDELRCDYPTESVVHTMECSGNGRTYFEPDAEGDQWSFGAVASAAWTGTPVRALLDEHGGATDGEDDELWLSAMGGEAPPDKDVFCRSIPLSKAREDCLLAYEMNGAPMSPEHGYPVRLVVPGWFGNNSVKWVEEIRVMDGWSKARRGPTATGRITPSISSPPTASFPTRTRTRTATARWTPRAPTTS